MKRWLDITSDEESQIFSEQFWSKAGLDLKKGEFWADEIKNLKANPDARLKKALDNFPLPAGFREAAIALRAIIRAKRKTSEDYSNELTFLYQVAAVNSFSVPYSKRLKEPGFNILESMPGAEVFSLTTSWYEIGYEKLELLKKTDIKWMVELWGEPKSHKSMNQIYLGLWKEYEDKLIEKRKNENRKFEQYFSESGVRKPRKKDKKVSLGFIITLLILAWYIFGR